MPRFAYRVCDQSQLNSFNTKNVAAFTPTTESNGIPQLKGRGCLVFTEDKSVLQHFASRIGQGGGILEIDLDAIDPADFGVWTATDDVHVAADAFIKSARSMSPQQMAQILSQAASRTTPQIAPRLSFKKKPKKPNP